MNWFLAKLVFRIICGNGGHTPQFDEQLRMICAEDELHAFYKARLLGEADCINNITAPAAGVGWKFIDVTELHQLHCCTDGAEVCSAVREEADADLYIRNTERAATRLLQHSLHRFTILNNSFIGT